jgi:hypothetical protein
VITKLIIKPHLSNTHNFEICDTTVTIGTISKQTPNILIKDINGITTHIIRHSETIRTGGTTVNIQQPSPSAPLVSAVLVILVADNAVTVLSTCAPLQVYHKQSSEAHLATHQYC